MDGTKQVTRRQTIRVNFIPLMSDDMKEMVHHAAWRISFWHEGEWKVLGTETKLRHGFARRKDAEVAMEALIKAGLDTAETVTEDCYKSLATIAEAMAW
jgi:hypothetical protein